MKVQPNTVHPAKYSPAVLALLGRLVDEETARVGRRLRLLDPLGGVGRAHDLRADTITGELELGWAACRRPAVQADATRPPFRPHSFDVYCTSPAYGNRMSDHHKAGDTHKKCKGAGCRGCKGTGISPRKSYTHANGRPLRANNGGAMPWWPEPDPKGAAYRQLHRQVWQQVPELLVPGGLALVNVSNFVRDDDLQPVVDWHIRALADAGMAVERMWAVPTKRMLDGANRDARAAYEHVLALRAVA